MFFSTMDANKGYHQFEIDERYRHLTAFTTQREGQWQFKRVPIGLQNAPAYFQRSMDSLLGRCHWQFCLAYIDDVVIWSRSWDEHLVHIGTVLSCFQAVGLTLDEKKCNWGLQSVDLLGLRVTRLGLRTLSSKTEAIAALPFPRTIKDLRIILGQFSYYRQFIPKFACIAEPLTSALWSVSPVDPPAAPAPAPSSTRKLACKAIGRMTVDPTPERVAALQSLKSLLTNPPYLHYPDFNRPFFLYTDASKREIGGALQQSPEGSEKQHPILFISRCLSPPKRTIPPPNSSAWAFTGASPSWRTTLTDRTSSPSSPITLPFSGSAISRPPPTLAYINGPCCSCRGRKRLRSFTAPALYTPMSTYSPGSLASPP